MGITRVERGGPTIWPWIMGLLIAALLVWALTETLGGDSSADTPPAPALAPAEWAAP